MDPVGFGVLGVVGLLGLVVLFGRVVLLGADPFGETLLGFEESGVPLVIDPFVADEPLMSEPLCMLFFLCLWCFDM